MDDDIELISDGDGDGDGLAVIGSPTAVERFLVSGGRVKPVHEVPAWNWPKDWQRLSDGRRGHAGSPRENAEAVERADGGVSVADG